MNEVVNKFKGRLGLIVLIVAIVIIASGFYFFQHYRTTHVSTDDAYVTGRIHVVASKVPGTVKTLLVKDNQFVKEKDTLLEIDDQDYSVKVRESESTVGAEKAKLEEIGSRAEVARKQLAEFNFRTESAKANLRLADVNLKQSQTDLKRMERLFANKIIAEEQYDKAKTAYEGDLARLHAAREQLNQARAALQTQNALIKQMESAQLSQKSSLKQKQETLEADRLKKSYTVIYAPVSGYVTKKSVEEGNQIQAGQPLMAIVPLADVWVIANYKETQLERVKPGQKVVIKVDSYSGKKFSGKVDSIMAGTGAAFSLFPPENATGNYVKVVQRVPVKIVLDAGTDPNNLLRVGMSVEPTIMVE
ncbi:MAG TPA: HlyD family secretion protein [Smithellaceae bacterium]|nr:HlyD family secretion protein [Smithellaceae bacterium]